MDRYLATAQMSFRESGYFGLMSLVGKYLLKALRLAALIMIWRQIFSGGAKATDMTLQQMLLYTILSAALSPLLDVRSPASDWLHEGGITSLYQRPMSISGQLIAHTIGSWAMHLMVFALPCALLAPALGLWMEPSSAVRAAFSLMLSVALGFAVDFLFACLIIRMKGASYSIEVLRPALTALFTGALIPFQVLPFGLGKLLAFSPLGALAGAPLSIAVGLEPGGALIISQLIWNALLWPLAALFYRKSMERMVSLGG